MAFKGSPRRLFLQPPQQRKDRLAFKRDLDGASLHRTEMLVGDRADHLLERGGLLAGRERLDRREFFVGQLRIGGGALGWRLDLDVGGIALGVGGRFCLVGILRVGLSVAVLDGSGSARIVGVDIAGDAAGAGVAPAGSLVSEQPPARAASTIAARHGRWIESIRGLATEKRETRREGPLPGRVSLAGQPTATTPGIVIPSGRSSQPLGNADQPCSSASDHRFNQGSPCRRVQSQARWARLCRTGDCRAARSCR